jgi:hypothetical protein
MFSSGIFFFLLYHLFSFCLVVAKLFVSPGKDSIKDGLANLNGKKGMYLMQGTHIVTDDYVYIHQAIKIFGAGRDQTFVKGGGFQIKGKKEEGKNVVLKDMTISETSENGVYGDEGLSWLCDRMTITQCGSHGVYANNTKGRLINCVITQCKYSGIHCYKNALIELEGHQTKVDGNVTSGNSYNYGLYASDTSSTIHLLFPLTKESVSTNNHRGRNYGSYNGGGIIETVNTLESL